MGIKLGTPNEDTGIYKTTSHHFSSLNFARTFLQILSLVPSKGEKNL